MYFGEPLTVPRDTSERQRETIRLELQNRLLALNQD
jgi:hypothetical protein